MVDAKISSIVFKKRVCNSSQEISSKCFCTETKHENMQFKNNYLFSRHLVFSKFGQVFLKQLRFSQPRAHFTYFKLYQKLVVQIDWLTVTLKVIMSCRLLPIMENEQLYYEQTPIPILLRNLEE